MFRKIYVIAILLTLLCSQSIAWPHSHAGMSSDERREHDSRPHLHLHSHGAHRHHDHSHDDTEDAGRSELILVDSSRGHDTDAVYASKTECTIHSDSHQRLNGIEQTLKAAFLPNRVCDLVATAGAVGQRRGKSVALDPEDSPLYLRTLSLRL